MSGSTYLDLLQLAAGELNLVAIGATVATNAALAQRLLDRLTWMVDSWNLKPTVVPWYQQQIFTLRPGQQTYLIGPNAPDWNAPRPIRLDPNATNLLLINPLNTGAAGTGFYAEWVQVNRIFVGSPPYSFLVNNASAGSYPVSILVNSFGPGLTPTGAGSSPVRIPLAVLSVQQWANINLPALQNSYPSGCYLDRSMIVGTNAQGQQYTASRISVWGIPTTVNQIEFFYWQALTVGNLNDQVNAAPGYFRAMFLKLAIEIAPGFGITPSALTIEAAADALGDIKELNAPDMHAQPDPGMPASKAAGYISKAAFLSGNF